MLALFAEPNGATFYLDIKEVLPKYYIPSYGTLSAGPRSNVKTYKLVALSKPLGQPEIAFYDRELQW